MLTLAFVLLSATYTSPFSRFLVYKSTFTQPISQPSPDTRDRRQCSKPKGDNNVIGPASDARPDRGVFAKPPQIPPIRQINPVLSIYLLLEDSSQVPPYRNIP
ncbi:hypothetical protein F5884DRAFT_746424 [Xylogone sp. PMI_703]|nr:hypothetical protein F5884DRAFT_746424 [Xylogone sp. PMI_703]